MSLDGRTILIAAGHDRVAAALRGKGYEIVELELSEFAACGGGLHCLTMPLRRERQGDLMIASPMQDRHGLQ